MPGQALQLYTLREFTKTADAVRTTLERVREIGFRAVQVSAVAALEADMSPDDLGRLLRELELQCIATHRPWASLLNETKREIDLHKAIGCDYVAIGASGGKDSTVLAYVMKKLNDEYDYGLQLVLLSIGNCLRICLMYRGVI